MVRVELRMPAGLVIVRVSGTTTPNEIVSELEAFRRRQDYVPGRPVLSDCRLMTTVLSSGDMHVVADALSAHEAAPAARVAAIVSKPVHFGLQRMFELRFAEHVGYRHHVCYEWDEAVRWLGLAPEEVPDC